MYTLKKRREEKKGGSEGKSARTHTNQYKHCRIVCSVTVLTIHRCNILRFSLSFAHSFSLSFRLFFSLPSLQSFSLSFSIALYVCVCVHEVIFICHSINTPSNPFEFRHRYVHRSLHTKLLWPREREREIPNYETVRKSIELKFSQLIRYIRCSECFISSLSSSSLSLRKSNHRESTKSILCILILAMITREYFDEIDRGDEHILCWNICFNAKEKEAFECMIIFISVACLYNVHYFVKR